MGRDKEKAESRHPGRPMQQPSLEVLGVDSKTEASEQTDGRERAI